MSAWPGKFVIGLTGNIATGKSEVRRMLEKLGAFGIDADAIAHQTILKGEKAYQLVVAQFGKQILSAGKEIDRTRLGKIVFSDPVALRQLESIIHPEVRKKINQIIHQTMASVIVIEAIKLIENGYPELCDTIWVTYAPVQVQLERLVEKRRMSRAEALQRISAQTAHDEKLRFADVIIDNKGDLDDTWVQVQKYWKKFIPANYLEN